MIVFLFHYSFVIRDPQHWYPGSGSATLIFPEEKNSVKMPTESCYRLKKKLIFFLQIRNCILLIPRPSFSTTKIQEKPSAFKREHPAFHSMNFSTFFCFFCVIFVLLDPDPLSKLNPDLRVLGSGSASNRRSIPGGRL
jgi:hypothetical protein